MPSVRLLSPLLATNLMVPPVARLAVCSAPWTTRGNASCRRGPCPAWGAWRLPWAWLSAAASRPSCSGGGWEPRSGRSELVALAFGTLLVFLVGIVDDLMGVSAAKKLLVQLVAAWPLVHAGWAFEVLRLPVLGEVHLGLFGGSSRCSGSSASPTRST